MGSLQARRLPRSTRPKNAAPRMKWKCPAWSPRSPPQRSGAQFSWCRQ